MDPNEALSRMLSLATMMLDIDYVHDYDDTHEISQAILDLDKWLSTGGYAPTRWKSDKIDASSNWHV